MLDESSRTADSPFSPETFLDRIASPRVVPLLLLGGWIAASSLLVAPLMDAFKKNDAGAVFVYVCFGIIAGGAGLTTIWGALGPGPFALRIGLSLSSAVQLFACWLVGYAIAEIRIDVREREDLLAALLCLPIVYLSIQLPLWIVGFLFSWRCESVGQAPSEPITHRLTIRKMMIGTALIAMSLAAARAGASVTHVSRFWMVLAIVCTSTAGISTVSTLPVVFATLLAHRRWRAISVLWIYVAIATSVAFIAINVVGPGGLTYWDMFGITTSVVSFVGVMTLAMMAARLVGLRLVSQRPSSARRVPVDRAAT